MLRHTDNLSKTLQAIPMCASEEARITATTVTTLQALRFGDQFPFLQYHVIKGKQESKVQNPELPRRKMTCTFEIVLQESFQQTLRNIIASIISEPWTWTLQ